MEQRLEACVARLEQRVDALQEQLRLRVATTQQQLEQQRTLDHAFTRSWQDEQAEEIARLAERLGKLEQHVNTQCFRPVPQRDTRAGRKAPIRWTTHVERALKYQDPGPCCVDVILHVAPRESLPEAYAARTKSTPVWLLLHPGEVVDFGVFLRDYMDKRYGPEYGIELDNKYGYRAFLAA